MGKASYTQKYSNFIGIDVSSDPRAVARNRLAHSVNMWRDYESEQGAAVETFPGFRRVAHSLGLDANGGEIGKVHGIYHFRSRTGVDFIVVHAGTKIYAFEEKALANNEYNDVSNRTSLLTKGVSDNDSTGFVTNNNLYIVDGHKIFYVYDEGRESPVVKASEIDPYVPTTYYNGNVLEQRNMLSVNVRQVETGESGKLDEKQYRDLKWYETMDVGVSHDKITGYKNFGGSYSENYTNPELRPNSSNFICIPEAHNKYDYYFQISNLGNNKDVKNLYIFESEGEFSNTASENNISGIWLSENAFENCANLKTVRLQLKYYNGHLRISSNAFKGCNNLSDVYLYVPKDPNGNDVIHYEIAEDAFPDQTTIHKIYEEPSAEIKTYVSAASQTSSSSFPAKYNFYEPVKSVVNILVDNKPVDIEYILCRAKEYVNNEALDVIRYICLKSSDISGKKITFELELHPNHFSKIENMTSFQEADLGYKERADEAITGCTKCAIYDGRVFLTGNPNLPNTVFYSQRNNTGANDPTYFGVYNYFNDGNGNTPNVDMLSTPSMLMIIKGNTVQDGSVYYHTGASNTDEDSKNLLPRIYPSTQGAAGLGSAGDTVPSRLSCNFFDDPVFLSKRGMEGVSKETVNLERTVQHRSSNVDRLLIREDLARATMAEWKKYLVICCNGHMYLADSRYMIQHTDGSYQYEWYYLEGVGTYEGYESRWEYFEGRYPYVDDENSLADYIVSGERIGDVYSIRADGAELREDVEIMHVLASSPNGSNNVDLYFVIEGGNKYIVVPRGEEKRGVGKFFGATKIVAVNDRLIFGTDNGDICIINTDMRGVSVDGRSVDNDRIDRSFYSFNGVPYLSGCAIRLDDCEQKLFTKNTVCGTTTARFKMMPGSHCYAMVSTNGRDWEKLGEAGSSRFDFADFDFTNMSFAENENNIVVFPEISRGWMNKQYYFYSDSFEAPFGLYELGYAYYVAGRIRY